MKIIKEFEFLGNFEKAIIKDNKPIENISGVIYCYDNGLVLLELGQKHIDNINNKRAFERVPLHGLKKDLSRDEKNEKILKYKIFDFESLESDWEIIQPAYEEDYIIKGKTRDNFSVSAIVWDNTRYKPKLILRELKINYDVVSSQLPIHEVKYGLTNLRLSSKISTLFPSSKLTVSIIPIEKQQSDGLDATLAAEMIFCDVLAESNLKCYSTWLIYLLAFACGNKVNVIYEITTYKVNNEVRHTEYWSGNMPDAKKSGILVIQEPHLLQFIQNSLPFLNPDTFTENGLCLALSWYLEIFETDIVNTQFICLCTAIETLIKKYSDNSNSNNSRLISKTKYREIRQSILEMLKTHGDNLAETNDTQESYEIFYKKVEGLFNDGGLNKIGNLGATLKEMLEIYQVYYIDLFPKFDFIGIRNNLVHQGYSEVESMQKTFLKLENLFIRIVLSMLKYKGNYMEHDGTQLICRNLSSLNNDERNN